MVINPEGVPKDGTIGVVVSGGFDSSILWHIVYGICLERGQKCVPFTVPKNDGALSYANRMLDWSWQHYGGKRKHPIVINANGVDWSRKDYQGDEVAEQLLGGLRDITDNNMADYIFTGVNAYPPDYETLCSYHVPGPRNLARETDKEYNGRKIKSFIFQPFADFTKADLVSFAFDLGILHDISEFSHSCVENIRGRCGECFWCKERESGYEQAGHLDIRSN